MKKETKKAAEMAAEKKDTIETNTTAIEKHTKPDTAPKAKTLILKLEDLEAFKEHPYKVIDDDSMAELTESIAANGILNPLLVRPLEGKDGKYEIISGHRRFHAAQKLGMKKLPCTVHFIDRDAATVMMVDSNCQRTELLPSEKAKAYKMKMDAISRQGKRTDLELPEGTSVPVAQKSNGKSARDRLGKEFGESGDQVRRYIRLTYLVDELLQYVDEGKIAMRPAVEMSYLDEETQRCIVDRIDESDGTVFPSHAQTRRIRQRAESQGITREEIIAILNEQKPNQKEKVKIPADELRRRIGKNMTDADFIKYLYAAVDYYSRFLQRQRDQPER